jgi:ribose-phosphate pyrophosphokinase
MKHIHLNLNQNIDRFVFPDNQPHVTLKNIEVEDEVTVTCAITDSVMMLQLLQTSNALDNLFARKKKLIIPYLLGARYDRLMLTGDSIDLKVIANLINSMQFEKVYLFDVHSETATILINHAINVSNEKLVKQICEKNAVLICPDAGAAKKVNKYLDWNRLFTQIVYCNKTRDVSNGKISLQVLEPEKCYNRNCVIIDDICDGGGTFLAIAQQIKPAHLTLVVTHGIFSKGFSELEKYFQQIIVSDSLFKTYDSKIVKQIPI